MGNVPLGLVVERKAGDRDGLRGLTTGLLLWAADGRRGGGPHPDRVC
ncbi:hypothetical protein ABZ348_09770 [Streptomyces sp. NPDC005963]